MTEQEMQDFLAANKEEISRSIREKMIAGLVAEHRWSISDQIAKAVNEFVAAEIIPEVKAHLQAEKGVIVASSIEAARQIGNLITEQMVKKAADNISGYGFRGVMEGIFR